MSKIRSRIRAAATATALALTTASPVVAMGYPAQGYPAQCSDFRIEHIQRDYGAAVEWSLVHECYFGQQTDIVVTTFADGTELDRHILRASEFHGRSARYVLLPVKPICGTTLVRVEARHGDRALGDLVSSEGALYFDPDRDC
jgi:hypothetical protein